jgi:predicted alpha/beta hydrolase family esterase
LILLKYVSEEEVENPVAGLFLVATPYVGTGGWEFEEGALREDFAAEIHLRLPVFLYHSHDDEVVPFAHLALYEAKLPQATIQELEGRGHQFDNDLSEVARDIKSL